MATYDSYTAEQKAQIQEMMEILRPWSGEQARSNNHGGAVDTAWLAGVDSLITNLDAAEAVPNASGLAGAQNLLREDVINLISYVQGIRTTYNTAFHRTLYGKAAGMVNLIG